MERRKLDPDEYIVKEDDEVADIDLDVEKFTHGGRPLTEADAERIAEETLTAIHKGGPSLDEIRRIRG